ncbi:MAG: GNAT family N-acetyltransferase [Roseiflexaceae bacterium]|nr:GNAT family N-acetyltransferase [Roseiflexaceae bacterium]
MLKLQVQQATPGDLGAVLPMMTTFYGGFGHAFDPARTEAALVTLLADPTLGVVWLLIEGQELVGYLVVIPFLSLEYGGITALLDELYVAEAARGRGIGVQALAAVESYARAAGMRAVMLEVDHSNQSARRLYERNGYRAVERDVLVRQLDEPGAEA